MRAGELPRSAGCASSAVSGGCDHPRPQPGRAGGGALTVATPRPSIFDARREQMFPELSAAELARVRTFGGAEALRGRRDSWCSTGEAGRGITVILQGRVAVMRRDDGGQARPGRDPQRRPGFMGELAQLAGRPSLVDGIAVGKVEAVADRPPERLRRR